MEREDAKEEVDVEEEWAVSCQWSNVMVMVGTQEQLNFWHSHLQF